MLPFVMAAYRSSLHQSTNYSPNYLMFGREVRAPADLVFGTQTEQAPTSYDDYYTIIVLPWNPECAKRMILLDKNLELAQSAFQRLSLLAL